MLFIYCLSLSMYVHSFEMDYTRDIPKRKKISDDVAFPALIQLDEFMAR